MDDLEQEKKAKETIERYAGETGLDVEGGRLRRTSSRFCFGVEHGDYNGTELFGVATDRYLWLAYKPNGLERIRLFSCNYPDEGIVEFQSGKVPEPMSRDTRDKWARFAHGVDYILGREGFGPVPGFDGIIYGNIPGGGMSRSAALTLNLILTSLEIKGVEVEAGMKIVSMSQAVENDYIGSPSGNLDQIMILFSRAGMGTHFDPRKGEIRHIPFGGDPDSFRLVSLDTGTERPGLEKSTYKTRREECERLVALANPDFRIGCLADVKDPDTYNRMIEKFSRRHPDLCRRLSYIYHAQQRFYRMLEAWKEGDIKTVGSIFREDGRGLRDVYEISGPELETMCDIARTVEGVYGERMLGGGDKGASGAIVKADRVDALRKAVDTAYPLSRPEYAGKYAIHVLKFVEGVKVSEL